MSTKPLRDEQRAWLGGLLSLSGQIQVAQRDRGRYRMVKVIVKSKARPEILKRIARLVEPSGKKPGQVSYGGSKTYLLMDAAWPYLSEPRRAEYLRKLGIAIRHNDRAYAISAENTKRRRTRELQAALIAKLAEAESLQDRREKYYYNQDPAVQLIHEVNIGDIHEMVLADQAKQREAVAEELNALLKDPMRTTTSLNGPRKPPPGVIGTSKRKTQRKDT